MAVWYTANSMWCARLCGIWIIDWWETHTDFLPHTWFYYHFNLTSSACYNAKVSHNSYRWNFNSTVSDMLNLFFFAIYHHLWPDLKKPGFHTHNIKLMISPEMDYWLNTLSYSTVCLAPKSPVWFLWQLFLDPV